jgi:hypothetical protein
MRPKPKRVFVALALLAVVCLTIRADESSSTARAQTGAEGTIAALQTRVAELKTSVAKRDAKIDQLRTQLADATGQGEATPTPTSVTSVEIDGVEIKVAGWELRQAIGSGPMQATPSRGAFLVVFLSMTNTAGPTKDVPLFGLMARDESGDTFSMATTATVTLAVTEGYTPLTEVALVAGVEQVVPLVFDVPATSASFELTNIERSFALPITEAT